MYCKTRVCWFPPDFLCGPLSVQKYHQNSEDEDDTSLIFFLTFFKKNKAYVPLFATDLVIFPTLASKYFYFNAVIKEAKYQLSSILIIFLSLFFFFYRVKLFVPCPFLF